MNPSQPNASGSYSGMIFWKRGFGSCFDYIPMFQFSLADRLYKTNINIVRKIERVDTT